MKREPYIHCQLKKNKNQSSNICWNIAISKVFFRELQTDDAQVAILHWMTDFTVGEIPLWG